MIGPDQASSEASGIGFSLTAEQRAVQQATAAFLRDIVIPVEGILHDPAGVPGPLVQDLQQKAREAGLFGPQIHPRWGGMGLDWRTLALVFEEAGVSLLGPPALNCHAPDEGNMHLLEKVATPEQQQRFLAPLARGDIRSCFAMTEPAPGAGSDPTMVRTRAQRDGDEWVIEGHKWYITGAQGAAFSIVMARTSDPDVDPEADDGKPGATMFLVPTDTPGFEIVRTIGSLDHASFLAGHAEIRLRDCRIGPDAVLGGVGKGLEYAQLRLAPARLTHCMRWLGVARRSLDIAARWANERTSGGRTLGEHQMVQAMLADSAIEIHAARLTIWQAAWVLDSGGAARAETQIAKVFVAETVNHVIDRAIQICGARGISDDLMLGLFYREARPFRIYDGASEVHRAAIARRVLRHAAQAAKDEFD
jgi:acyl-CoA dehydrogenase